MPVIALVAALVVLGLTIKFWFVVLPILAIAATAWGGRTWWEKHDLSPDERQAHIEQRRQRRRARTANWEAQAKKQREAKQAKSLARGKAVDVPISQVGRGAEAAGLACPRCGGAWFKARRSTGARVGIATTTLATGGIGGLGAAAVTNQKQVQCITCGARYKRG